MAAIAIVDQPLAPPGTRSRFNADHHQQGIELVEYRRRGTQRWDLFLRGGYDYGEPVQEIDWPPRCTERTAVAIARAFVAGLTAPTDATDLSDTDLRRWRQAAIRLVHHRDGDLD
jgi:hypothetical protein